VNRAILIIAAVPFLLAASNPGSDWKSRALASAAPYIDKANDEGIRAIVNGDAADVLSAPYAANGIFIGPDGKTIHVKAAVRAMYAKPPVGVKVIKASIHSDGRVAHDPDDVYEWGTSTVTVQRGKLVRQTSEKYLTVWHRVGTRWLITHNIAF